MFGHIFIIKNFIMTFKNNKLVTNSLFYSEKDFLFDQTIGLDFVKQDINQTVLLYKVDRQKTVVDELYGETSSDGVIYKEPVELNVIYFIDSPKNIAHDKKQNVLNYQQIGNLTITVYLKTLEENDIDIDYGDYVGVQVSYDKMEYFTVTNDGRMNMDNKHTRFGYKQLYRTISCVPVDKSEFKGI